MAVIGDVILDEYLVGQVNRISPEAPVPIHLVTSSLHGAGGAANAARNVQLAGGRAVLLSVVGDDEPGRQLREILERDGIDVGPLEVVSDRPTIRKTRITAASQQLVRIDWERVHPIPEAVQQKLLRSLESLKFDALLVSDYGKGTLPISLLTQAMELAASRGVPVVVDPKGRDFSKYLRATLITPNRAEACDALGLDPTGDWTGEELGRRLQKTFGLQNVLVTLGPKGMVLVPSEVRDPSRSARPIELPAIAREVYDVSGAGDTVVAIMTLALAAAAGFEEAMRLAQTAAALVVQKWGTQPVRLAELQSALAHSPQRAHSSQNKITTREHLRYILKEPKTRSQKVVFTNGCFDILHAGHVAYLEEARALGDVLVVGVNSDASVKRLKGSARPIVTLENRMRLLAALQCVDYVVPFDEDTPKELIEAVIPDVLVKGADWAKEDIVGGDFVRSQGGVVDTIPFVPGLSTTQIVEKIRESYLDTRGSEAGG